MKTAAAFELSQPGCLDRIDVVVRQLAD